MPAELVAVTLYHLCMLFPVSIILTFPLVSVPRILARLLERSPIASPRYSSGTVTSSFIIGSSRTRLALLTAFCKAFEPAILKAISEEIRLPKPFVAPTSAGGVGLEWEVESGKELLLEISPAGELSYLLVTPRPDGGESEIEDVIDGSAKLHKLFSALRE